MRARSQREKPLALEILRFPLPSYHIDLLCISKEGYTELVIWDPIGLAREARGTRTGGKRHPLLGGAVLEANF